MSDDKNKDRSSGEQKSEKRTFSLPGKSENRSKNLPSPKGTGSGDDWSKIDKKGSGADDRPKRTRE